jgi:endonuclease G
MSAMHAGLVGLVVLLAVPAWAADCTKMTELTGAPAYRGDAPEHQILCRLGYVLAHNPEHRVPDWVLELLTPDRFSGPGDRDEEGNPFAADPDLDPSERSELPDYTGSGFDRGHMAPAASMKFSREAMRESFYLSNMAPQVGIGLNRGIWAELEEITRTWTCGRGRLVVITGPIYGERPKRAKAGSSVHVPEAFYKIAYDPDRRRAIAFVLPNKKIDKRGRSAEEALKDHIVSIHDIEDRTGLDFLSALSRRDQNRLESRKAAMWPVRGSCRQS